MYNGKRVAIGVMVGMTALGSCLVLSARAATLYWDAPTKFEDGSKLLKSQLKGYEVQYWVDGKQKETQKSITVLNGNSYKTDLPLAPDVNYIVQIAAVSSDGQYSKWAVVGAQAGSSSSLALSSVNAASSSAPNPITKVSVSCSK